jgi:hypothetical protein
MRVTLFSFLILLITASAYTQIADMNWQLDYQIYLKLANDSNYTYDVREAFHVNDVSKKENDFVFYPVNPGQEYADELNKHPNKNQSYKTLWNALHGKLGGGWIHFTNCIAYALETQKLDLESPLMMRPQSSWKPKPMTQSFKRTKKWVFYIPYSQKNAQLEYKKRLEEDNLGDLENLPQSYIDLFLNTRQKDYDGMIKNGDLKKLAEINLVKIILGANYLGETQINYISNAVLESVLTYSSNMLPSLIIFDEFDAAAAMSLNINGYKIERVVFRPGLQISESEANRRRTQIEDIIQKINAYNRNSFKKRLGNYYGN